MAKIALVQAVCTRKDHEFYIGHLGLSFLSQFLKSQGHEVLVADRGFHVDFIPRVYDFSPEFIGLNMGVDTERVRSTAKTLRSLFPQSPLIIGGPYLSLHPEKAMRDTAADIGVVGDGIPIIQNIIEGDYSKSGIITSDGKGVTLNGRAEYAVDNWKLDPSALPKNRFQVYPFVTSMGCWGKCTYCSERRVSPRISFRPLEDVVEDIEILKRTRGVSWLEAMDSDFLIKKERFSEFMEMLKARPTPLIGFQARADDILKAGGELAEYKDRIQEIEIGIESFLPAQLERWNKGITVEKNMAAIELLRQLRVRTYFNLILGDKEASREQTLGEFSQTKDFFCEHPEYLPLIWGVNLMIYEGEIYRYPVFARNFFNFFDTIAFRNTIRSRGGACESFYSGKTVPQKSKDIIRGLLEDFYSRCVKQQFDSEKCPAEVDNFCRRQAITLGAFSNVMYDY